MSRIVHKAFKYRLEPTPEQKEALAVQFGCARFVWNIILTLRTLYFEDNGEWFGFEAATGLLTWFKETQYPWLQAANAQVLQQSLKNQQAAFDNFFRRVKLGIRPAGYPRFKSKRGRQSIRYPQPPKQLLVGNRIKLSKVGLVKVVLHRPVEGKVKSVTVSREPSGKYFVSILCEVEIPEVPICGPPIGIDLGLKHFAVFSNEEPPELTHKHLQASERKLAQLQRKLARQKQGSIRYAKTKQRIARLHEHIANQRRDFQHKLSAYLTWRYGFIAFETLNIRGMVKNHTLAKAVSNAAWAQFVAMCEYKGDWYGCEVVRIDQWYPSTRLCRVCDRTTPFLTLSDREWVCPNCATVHDRDRNAALNILDEGLRIAGYGA